jgi:hypothetical protein
MYEGGRTISVTIWVRRCACINQGTHQMQLKQPLSRLTYKGRRPGIVPAACLGVAARTGLVATTALARESPHILYRKA